MSSWVEAPEPEETTSWKASRSIAGGVGEKQGLGYGDRIGRGDGVVDQLQHLPLAELPDVDDQRSHRFQKRVRAGVLVRLAARP